LDLQWLQGAQLLVGDGKARINSQIGASNAAGFFYLPLRLLELNEAWS
jgi:hypothetical protein